MSSNARKKIILRIATVLAAVAVLLCAAYIISFHLGLNEEYDFGAGAYYYADAPQIQEMVEQPAYQTAVPTWIHIVLFLSWGWLMWRLWIWVDGRITKKDYETDPNA